MDNNHIIKANRTALGHFRTRPAFQYDYGQVLMLSGFTLPQAFEVHFGIGNGKSITMIGTEDQVQIPDECLRNAGTLTAWLFLHDAETDGETRFVIEIPVNARAEITNQEPTPVQQDVITQAIAALNTGVEAAQAAQEAAQSAREAAETAQEEAEAAAESVKNADATAETLEPGSQATVVVEDVDGVKTFKFGLVKGDKGDRGEQGIQGVPGQDGYTPQKGIDYFDGKPGYTPIKGVDYFDGEPGQDGYTPIKGVDYFDGHTPVKGVDYFDGAPGEPGNDGFSPSVAVSEITGGHRVAVTNKTGSSSFDVMDGQPGGKGDPGSPGQDGVSPTLAVTDITGGHRITITDKNGSRSIDVMDGEDGQDGYTPVKGVDYFDGAPGEDGVSPTVTVTPITDGNQVTITDKTGAHTFNVMDGEKGDPGDPGTPGTPGQDGVSPTLSVADITGGHRITITDKTGTRSVDVMDGEKGDTGDSGVYYGSATPTDPDVRVWIDPEGSSTFIDDTAGEGDTNKVWSADKVNEVINDLAESLPTEETAQELLENEFYNTGLTDTTLAVIGMIFNNLPQDEPAIDVVNSLSLECERLQAIYENWMSERGA